MSLALPAREAPLGLAARYIIDHNIRRPLLLDEEMFNKMAAEDRFLDGPSEDSATCQKYGMVDPGYFVYCLRKGLLARRSNSIRSRKEDTQ